jgi:hypothetical protein
MAAFREKCRVTGDLAPRTWTTHELPSGRTSQIIPSIAASPPGPGDPGIRSKCERIAMRARLLPSDPSAVRDLAPESAGQVATERG